MHDNWDAESDWMDKDYIDFDKLMPPCPACKGTGYAAVDIFGGHGTCAQCKGSKYKDGMSLKDLSLGKFEDNKFQRDPETRLNGETGQVELVPELDPEEEAKQKPTWTEVRGVPGYFYICPVCCAMIPYGGPKISGRSPKEHHEHWHKTVLCDWYKIDEEQ